MNRNILVILVYVILFCSGLVFRHPSTFAQETEPKQVEQSKELSFLNPKQRSLELPFKLVNNLIVIPIQINGSDTLRFMLDTGLNTSIICEQSTAEKLKLNYAREIRLHGLGSGEPLKAIHTFGNNINVSGIAGINQDYFILTDNVFHLSNKMGYRIDGILSFSVFNSFIVEINYEDEVITFYHPGYFRYQLNNRNYVTLPLFIQNKKPFIYIKMVLRDGQTIPLKVLLDTGASNSLWMDINSIPGFRLPEDAKESFLGSGLSGDVKGHVARFDKIFMDRFELNDVIVSLPDSVSIDKTARSDNRNGSIGAEILRRYNIILDYPNELVTLKRNAKFHDPFSFNMTGIELTSPYPDKNYYLVSQIRKDSPADRAGIRVDDIVVSINNTNMEELSLSEIYKLFQSGDGKKIRIVINRNGETIKYILELEKFI